MKEETTIVNQLDAAKMPIKPFQPKNTYSPSLFEKSRKREKIKKQMEEIEKVIRDLGDYIYENRDLFE